MFNLPSPLEKLELSTFGVKQKVYIKRDDLIHPIVSGNKWRKLNFNFRFYHNNNYSGVISMGGAFSSHIQSLSLICFMVSSPPHITLTSHILEKKEVAISFLG